MSFFIFQTTSTGPIRRQPVCSSNLSSVGYEALSGTLDVGFRNGAVYRHSRVPESLHDGLVRAPSKGAYYATYLRNQYGCRRIA